MDLECSTETVKRGHRQCHWTILSWWPSAENESHGNRCLSCLQYSAKIIPITIPKTRERRYAPQINTFSPTTHFTTRWTSERAPNYHSLRILTIHAHTSTTNYFFFWHWHIAVAGWMCASKCVAKSMYLIALAVCVCIFGHWQQFERKNHMKLNRNRAAFL